MGSDRDAVLVSKSATPQLPETVEDPAFLATFSLATEQASKLGLSGNKSAVCMYREYQVVHFNHSPLFVSLIASDEANTGMLLSIGEELAGSISQLATVFQNAPA